MGILVARSFKINPEVQAENVLRLSNSKVVCKERLDS